MEILKMQLVAEDMASTEIHAVVRAIDSMTERMKRVDDTFNGQMETGVLGYLKKAWDWIKKGDKIIDEIEKWFGRLSKIWRGDKTKDASTLTSSLTLKTEEAEKTFTAFSRVVEANPVEAILSLKTFYAEKTITDFARVVEAISIKKLLTLDASPAIRAVLDAKAMIDRIMPDIMHKYVIVHYQTQSSPIKPFSEGIEYIRQKMQALPSEGRYAIKAIGHQGSEASGSQNITFSPTIHINGTDMREGRSLAREIDRELARIWRSDRSELKKTLRQ